MVDDAGSFIILELCFWMTLFMLDMQLRLDLMLFLLNSLKYLW